MRIALLQPTYWPEVWRGSERIVHDIGTQLAAAGDEVSLLTSHRAPARIAVEDGIRVIRDRRPARPPLLDPYEDHVESVPAMTWRLLRGGYDVAHAFVPAYAWAAVKARRLGGPPVVFSLHGIPERHYLVYRRHRLPMLQTVVSEAAASTVLSEAAARPFRRYLLEAPEVLPAGYFRRDFERRDLERAPVPTLVCAADLGDARKRGRLLLSAFTALRQRRPTARLVLVRPAGTAPTVVGDLPAGVAWLEATSRRDIVGAYATAWASVLAAVEEALGLVMIESLASGTPVVAARTGAGPEIVTGESLGRLFEPDSEDDLIRAMDEALALASQPGVAETCRERVAGYEWEQLLAAHQRLYRLVMSDFRQDALA